MRINQKARIFSGRFNQKISRIKNSGDVEDFVAIVIPVNPQELLLLPEGERTKPTIKVFTAERLELGELLVVGGEKWRVTVADNWGEYGYFNNRATRLVSTQKGYSNGFKFISSASGER